MRQKPKHDPATVRAIAKSALIEVASSPRSTPSARAQAARTLLEMLGDLKREKSAPGDRELHELSEAELDEEIRRLRPMSAPNAGVNVGVATKRFRKAKTDQTLS